MKAPAAIGLRTHSGWAALVVLGGAVPEPRILERRRVEMADPRLAGSKQPYHEAEGLDPKRAEALLERLSDSARRMARSGITEVVADLERSGHRIVGCGLLLGSGRGGASLSAILASHALIHTADGDHFRDALTRAAEGCGLSVTGVKEREVAERGAAVLGLATGDVQRRLVQLGRPLGPPWTQDQKYAALVAWMVLVQNAGRG